MPRSTTELGTYTTVAQSENLPTSPSKQTSSIDDEDDDDDRPQNESSSLSAADLALPRTAAPLPPGALYIALVELCERFAYYGLSGPFQNYIANPPFSALPGRLGYGQSRATALTNAFQCWCYVTPVLGALIADQYWGKYATIKRFSAVYMVGILILFLSSLTEAYAGIGLIVAMGVIGLGTGGIKSNVSPMIAEQVAFSAPYVVESKGGRRRLVDPGVTLQKVFMFFYTCINIGSVAALSTTLLEKYAGFGAAYGVPLLVFGIGFGVLVRGRKTYVVTAPQGGVVRDCGAILLIASRHGFDLDAARGKGAWSDSFVDEVRHALGACRVFLFFPVYWLTFSQMMNNFVSQGPSSPPPKNPSYSSPHALTQHTHSLPPKPALPAQRHPPHPQPANPHPAHPANSTLHLPPPALPPPHHAHNHGLLLRVARHGIRFYPAILHLVFPATLHPYSMAKSSLHPHRNKRDPSQHYRIGTRVRARAQEHEVSGHERVFADECGRECAGDTGESAGEGGVACGNVCGAWAGGCGGWGSVLVGV
jgi:hypothetical protein